MAAIGWHQARIEKAEGQLMIGSSQAVDGRLLTECRHPGKKELEFNWSEQLVTTHIGHSSLFSEGQEMRARWTLER